MLIDPKAVMYLLGTEMDYVTEKLSSQFVFNNPNQDRLLRLWRGPSTWPRLQGQAGSAGHLVGQPSQAQTCHGRAHPGHISISCSGTCG